MIRPIGDRIIVRRLEVTQKSDSIITPDQFLEKPVEGVVVAHPIDFFFPHIGFIDAKRFGLALGAIVRFGDMNAEDVEVDGERLSIVRIQDVRYVRD